MCVNEQRAMANRKPSQSWDNLRYFLVVARTGTLSAAAEQLGTEHTTVARHIHVLEDELNSRLFHRSNSGLTARPGRGTNCPNCRSRPRRKPRTSGKGFRRW